MSVLPLADMAVYSVVERAASTLSVVSMLAKLPISISPSSIVKCSIPVGIVYVVNIMGSIEAKSGVEG